MKVNASFAVASKPPAARAAIVFGFLISALGSVASPTPMPVVLSGLCLAFLVHLLWDARDPPILLLPALFQWSEVAILPLSTIWEQVPLQSLSIYGADIESSATFGLAGVASLGLGLRIGSGSSKRQSFKQRIEIEASLWGYDQIKRFAFTIMAMGYLFSAISNVAGPARELFLHLAEIKYAGLFSFAYWCLRRDRHLGVLTSVMLFEITFGMTGFFAEFKFSILTLFVAALASRPRLGFRDVVIVGLAGATIMFVAIFWTAVKPGYRMFVNRGSGAQVVDVALTDRLDYLSAAAGGMTGEKFVDGFNRLVSRHGYIEYLALTMAHVPAGAPHEDGNLTKAVIEHLLFPRIFFPDKPPLPSDTVIMAKYAGLSYTWDENTSISIGNLGELYIDFGYLGALFGIGFIGIIVGYVYHFLREHSSASDLISSSLCILPSLSLAYFGMAYIKLIGGVFYASIIAMLAQSFITRFTELQPIGVLPRNIEIRK